MSLVWDLSHLSQSETLVALALADHADESGKCWPSIDRIAEKARLKRRQTQTVIRRLENMGVLSVERGVGRNQTSKYQFQIKGAENAPFEEAVKGAIDDTEKVQSVTEKVQSTTQKGAVAIAPESPITTKEPPKNRQTRATRLPEDFTLTPERRAVAEAEQVPAERTFAKFCDYWRAESGQKARKRDWDATWRNWCRREADGSPGRRKSDDFEDPYFKQMGIRNANH